MQHATDALLKFRDERNWKQFHDPKNLAAALGIEAAELNEVFLWKTTEESREVELAKVKEELADVLAYALLLANEFATRPRFHSVAYYLEYKDKVLAFIDARNHRIEEWMLANG